MKYAIFLFLLVFFIPNIGFAVVEYQDNSPEERIPTNTKINSILLKWQSSENKEQFAKANGLLYKEGKIQVYIHLTDKEFLSEISSKFEVVASDDKIAVAYVAPEQLDEFENLEYVGRVTPPDLARTNPIPLVISEQTQTDKDKIPLVLIISIISSGIILSVFLHKKRTKK